MSAHTPTTNHRDIVDSEAIRLAIEAAEARLTAKCGHRITDLSWWHQTLLKKSSVEVGWRESCGTTDPTAKIRAEWVKIVKKMEKAGVRLTVERVKHDNGWATKCGGFWNSEIFSLPALARTA